MGLSDSADLLFRIGADPSGATGALNRFRSEFSGAIGGLRGDFSGFAGTMEGLISSMGGAWGALAVAVTGSFAAVGSALIALGADAAKYADEIDQVNDTTGLAHEEISKLRYAAEQSGVQFDQFSRYLTAFAASVDAAADGSEKQEKAFARMGITQAQVRQGQQDLLPLLMRVADAFHENESAVEKTAIARALFTRGGSEMVEFLTRGSAQLREFALDAERMGLVITERDVTAAKEFTVELKALEAQARALKIEIGTALLPVLTAGAVGIEAIIGGIKKAWGTWNPLEKSKLFLQGVEESGTAAARRIQNAMETATGTRGFGAGEGDGGAGNRKAALQDYTRLSTLLDQVADKTGRIGDEESRAMAEVFRMEREAQQAMQGLLKLRKEGLLDPEAAKRETDAYVQLLPAIRRYYDDALKAIGEKRTQAAVETGRELLQQIAQQGQQTYEIRQADWDREMDALRAKMEHERTLTADNEALLARLREEGHRKIQRGQEDAFAQELTALQSHLAQMATARMTSAERIRWQYDQAQAQYSPAAEERAKGSASNDAEREAIAQQFAMNRAAAFAQMGAQLTELYNSQGWQGMFGGLFAEQIRGNEELLREWATSSNQSLMMVRVSLQSLNEMGMRAFNGLAQGMAQNIANAIVYKQSIGEAMKAALAATLASIAAESYVQAIYATALGFVRLAQWDFAGAANAFTAAGIFATVGTAAALAGRAVAPGRKETGGRSQETGGGAGSGSGGSGAAGGAAEARPSVTVYVMGGVYGKYGVEELVEVINDAVENRDVKLVASGVK